MPRPGGIPYTGLQVNCTNCRAAECLCRSGRTGSTRCSCVSYHSYKHFDKIRSLPAPVVLQPAQWSTVARIPHTASVFGVPSLSCYCCIQAVLHHLGRQDYASLRQVSRSTCEDITRHIPHIHEPYISLLLSQKTSSRQVAQWFQATRCFQHVSSIHVLIEGHVPTELFEQAMELLSERTDVTELHLQAFIAFDTTKQQQKACLTTLQPIKHLLPRLKTLALKDITIIMPYTLQQLIAAAPATGWQLQCLFISTPHWCQTRRIHLTEFSSTLHNLTRAFPNLRQLHLQVPEVDSGSIVVRKEAYDGTAAAVNLAVIPTADAYEDRLGRYPCTSQQAEVAKVALTAAIANAVLQLKFLESLTICDMPDIWILSSNEENPTALTMAAEMPEEKVAFANLVLNGELSSVRAAAAVFDTLDDCGCWLLQQHINLTKLSITTAETNWKMSWWQQDVQPNPALGQTTTTTINSNVAINGSQLTGGGTRTNQAAATPNRANIQMCVDVASCDFTCAPDLQHEMIAPHGGANHNLLRSAFIRDLRMYSLRPAPFLLCNTSSCNLELLLEHTESLAGLLADMKSLKVLKVRCAMQINYIAGFEDQHIVLIMSIGCIYQASVHMLCQNVCPINRCSVFKAKVNGRS